MNRPSDVSPTPAAASAAVAQPAGAQRAPLAPQAARQVGWLATCAIVGVVLYVLIDTALHLLPPHYNPIAHPESEYARGPYGYLMTINFALRGLLSLALLVGLARGIAPAGRSRWGLARLGVWGVGALLLAIFPTDALGARITPTGAVHLLVALIAFVAIAFAEPLLAARLAGDARWATWRPAT